MNTQANRHHGEPWYRSRGTVVIAMFTAILAFFLLREHWDHLAGLWVYGLLLLCPLMHFFGHGRHGGHGKKGDSNDSNS